MIKVNFTKAVDITKARLRVERAPLLETLDIEVMKNISSPTKIAEIDAKKQVLRDVTKSADTCETLEELKALKATMPQ